MKPPIEYIIVAVLSSCTDDQPYPPKVLIHNIAGGNRQFLPRTDAEEIDSLFDNMLEDPFGRMRHDIELLHWIIGEAKKSEDATKGYILIADEP